MSHEEFTYNMVVMDIAQSIHEDWSRIGKGVSPFAKPYLDALRSGRYGIDSPDTVIRYFLANASSYRGSNAREFKATLKQLLDDF